MKDGHSRVSALLFALWGISMIILLFGAGRNGQLAGIPYEDQLRMNINLTPFETVHRYIRILSLNTNPYLLRHAFINLAGNVVMFMPMGIFFPRFVKLMRGFFGFTFFSALMIFAVETAQLFTLRGSFDVDDIILNMAGALTGFILCRIFMFFRKRRKSKA